MILRQTLISGVNIAYTIQINHSPMDTTNALIYRNCVE